MGGKIAPINPEQCLEREERYGGGATGREVLKRIEIKKRRIFSGRLRGDRSKIMAFAGEAKGGGRGAREVSSSVH